jgi:ATP/maltotriose-dependent transcriptional regulator MalT
VADYLVAEVLERQPPELRAFLLRTSVLDRLSGPLCDAVLETRGSAALLLAAVRHAVGDLPGAGALLDEAGELVQQLTDPGVLAALVTQAQRPLSTAPRRQAQVAAPLTVRELAVVRLLSTRLSSREIAQELSVSVTTVRSQIQAIYRKLQASTRAGRSPTPVSSACSQGRGARPRVSGYLM